MSKLDFILLYEKFLEGNCTDEEKAQLEAYYIEIKLMDNEWDDSLGDEQYTKGLILSKMRESIVFDQLPVPTVKKRAVYSWIGYAASIMLIISVGGHFLTNKQHKEVKIKHVIKPGKSQAYLTLANGESIVLREVKIGQISAAGGLSINKLNDSTLAYKCTKSAGGKMTVPDSNILNIPRGGIYKTVLSDGTKVWLNSASTLKFPVAFAGRERRVVLTGEAYFEVAKNKAMPFKVIANGVDVKVLGTHFNVTSYPEDKVVKTTLLEGSVMLYAAKDQAILVPGQQGVLDIHKPNFIVDEVNTADVVAWKDGFFVFDNVSITTIMQNISRWYNVDVVYQGKPGQTNFGGTVSRYKNIDAVLKGLERTGSVHFKTEGRRVIVMD